MNFVATVERIAPSYSIGSAWLIPLASDMSSAPPDCGCIALQLVPCELVRCYKHAMLNIHPALLPSFGGKGYYGEKVHTAVIASGARYGSYLRLHRSGNNCRHCACVLRLYERMRMQTVSLTSRSSSTHAPPTVMANQPSSLHCCTVHACCYIP